MRSFFGWSVAIAIAVALLLAGPAQAKPMKVRILTTSQSALIAKGMKVAVSGRPGSRARVAVTSSSFDEGRRGYVRPRTVRLSRRGSAVVKLRLAAWARRATTSCAARAFVASSVGSGRTRGRARASMAQDRPDCRVRAVDLSRAADCDFIAQPKEGMCMMPFPNDYYTVKAPRDLPQGMATGRRIRFTAGGMPQNKSKKPIDPTGLLASDGFSQGQAIVLKVPGLDTPEALEANNFVGLAHLGEYSRPNQRAVVIDATTGRRWPIWVELDSQATSPEETALKISPSVNFASGHRYVVALRNLTDAKGRTLKAPDAFRYYRDSMPSFQRAVNRRRAHFEGIFRTLRRAKIKRSDLYLAWDFTVASDQNIFRRALHMRDEAFKTLGDMTMGDNIRQGTSPDFVVNEVSDVNGPQIKRRIRGTYTVPCFLTKSCLPGAVMDLDANGLPQRNGNYEAKFTCIVPQVALAGQGSPKLRPFVFGHGLLGTGDQVTGSINPDLAQEHAMIACGTDEIGMASEDLPFVAIALQDLSGFSVVPDRLQQGLINELFLARLMYHPDGLGTDPAFQDGDGENPGGDSMIRTDHVYYMGASQGGIMGGPLTAISPDFTQSALVVGAMNYSTLLSRSTDWPAYGTILNGAYKSELSRPLVLSIIQMLWDRGEPNGYAHRMTDNPPPNTPPHKVLLHVALGDHQVSNFASDVEARTVGLHTPLGGVSEQRWPDYDELWNVPRIKAGDYPFTGSAVVYWDGGPFRTNPAPPFQNIGTGTPPIPNLAPTSLWEDPHGAPRGAPGPVAMIDTFFDPNGYIGDYCGGEPCLASDWDGDFENVIPPNVP